LSSIRRRELLACSSLKTSPGISLTHPDINELPYTLYNLIAEFPLLSMWVLYIENEFDSSRRQRAYFSKAFYFSFSLGVTSTIKTEMKKLLDRPFLTASQECVDIIRNALFHHLMLPEKSAYDKTSFLEAFCAKGGYIEALPVAEDCNTLIQVTKSLQETLIFMQVTPGGEILIYGAADKVSNLLKIDTS
jgi:hypothetical protein